MEEYFLKENLSFLVIREEQTLMPVIDNSNKDLSLAFLRKVVEEALKQEKDFLIFDRLFFTHIFRTKSSMDDYREIEDMLEDKAHLFFLKIEEQEIPERIAKARVQRGKGWDEYVGKKGRVDEVNKYYIDQQRLLLELLKETRLDYEIYDTSKMDFDGISKNILRAIK